MADRINSLLCDEECFDDANGDKVAIFSHVRSDTEQPLVIVSPFMSEECIDWMLQREKFHVVRDDYLMRLRSGELDLSLRRQALDWMFKACAHHNFGDLCLFLAMNYLDRLLSVYNLPVGKTWAIQLAAVACLSLAAKIDEVYVPSTIELQAGEPKYIFEGKTIQRMEILVLSCLNWNVKPYTPFNFIDYFIGKLNDVESLTGPLISRSIQVITGTIRGIDFFEFKPSEIAAAVAIYVSGETRAMLDIDKALSSLIIVEKEKVLKCLEMIQDLITISGTSSSNIANNGLVISSLIPNSPNGVLEAASCLSYKSDSRRVRSSDGSLQHTNQDAKRRKLEPSNNNR